VRAAFCRPPRSVSSSGEKFFATTVYRLQPNSTTRPPVIPAQAGIQYGARSSDSFSEQAEAAFSSTNARETERLCWIHAYAGMTRWWIFCAHHHKWQAAECRPYMRLSPIRFFNCRPQDWFFIAVCKTRAQHLNALVYGGGVQRVGWVERQRNPAS